MLRIDFMLYLIFSPFIFRPSNCEILEFIKIFMSRRALKADFWRSVLRCFGRSEEPYRGAHTTPVVPI